MRAKEYLLQVRKLDRLIENKLREIEQWKIMAQGVGSIGFSERVQTSHSADKMTNAVHRYIEIEDELAKDISKYITIKQQVIATIEKLEAEDYDILHKIYIQDLTLDRVADLYGKSYSWVASTQGRAMQRLQTIIDSAKKCKEL